MSAKAPYEKYQPPVYPSIGVLVRHGLALTWLVVLACLAAGALASLLLGNWLALAVSIPVAALAYLLLKSYVEVLTIIADTLMPR